MTARRIRLATREPNPVALRPRIVTAAIDRLVGTMARVRHDHGTVLTRLNIGGGHGISYTTGDPALDPSTPAASVEDPVTDAYHHRMASSYDAVPRPPAVAVAPGGSA